MSTAVRSAHSRPDLHTADVPPTYPFTFPHLPDADAAAFTHGVPLVPPPPAPILSTYIATNRTWFRQWAEAGALGRTPRSALAAMGVIDFDTADRKGRMRTLERFLRSEHARELGPSDRAVLRELVNAAGPRDARYRDRRFVAATYIGVDALAERAGVSKATVKRALLRLVEAGLIARSPNYRLNTVTVVELPWVPPKPKPTQTPPLGPVQAPPADDPRGGSPRAPTGINMIPLGAQNEPAHLSEYICTSTSAAVASTTATETPRAAGANGGGVAAAAAAVSSHEGEPTEPDADPRFVALVDALLAAGITGSKHRVIAATMHAAGGTDADVQRVRREHAKRPKAGTGLLVRMLEDEIQRLPALRRQREQAAAIRAADTDRPARAGTPSAWERAVAAVDAQHAAQQQAQPLKNVQTQTPTNVPKIPTDGPLAAALARTSAGRRNELHEYFRLLLEQGSVTIEGRADWLAEQLGVATAWRIWKRANGAAAGAIASSPQATEERRRELARVVADVAAGRTP